jgi:hypothetical protein
VRDVTHTFLAASYIVPEQVAAKSENDGKHENPQQSQESEAQNKEG